MLIRNSQDFEMETVAPGQSAVWTWEEPALSRKILLVKLGQLKYGAMDFDLAKFQVFEPIIW